MSGNPKAPQMQNQQVVCAWCGKVIHEGNQPVSHGMCPECYEKFPFEKPHPPVHPSEEKPN
jgi:hypothetical protein